ncbi:MAG TPA: LuxR C-terminal-related transcriptional regulator [Enterobacteriaceae bacterium]|nr:LuxR C-terminal-related transcriptional regulator [Enterobacteriaceae bacterium]
MTIYGKDRFFICGIEKVLKQLSSDRENPLRRHASSIYVTTGMDMMEMYSLFFSRPPDHYAIFISSERYFDTLSRLFPNLIKLCLSEKMTAEELRQSLQVMSKLAEQNQQPGYTPYTFKFTGAEQQIMRLILRGHSLDDIARIRGVSPTTVSVQRNGLMKRTGTKSLQELCSLYSAMRAESGENSPVWQTGEHSAA